MKVRVSSSTRRRVASGMSRSGPCPVSTASPCTADQMGYSMPSRRCRVEHAGVDQLVECGAELTQGRAVRPGPVVRSAVGVLLRHGERGGEQPRFLAGELQVRDTDRAQPAAGRGGIAVLAAHAGDAGGHPVGELAHGRRADRGEELVTVGEVPVGGVGHHAHHPGRLTEHHRVRAAGAGQLEPGGDQAVADGAARTASPLRLGFRLGIAPADRLAVTAPG